MMKFLLDRLLTGWSWIRIIRVLAGAFILVSGLTEHNAAFIALGAAFLTLALFSQGVCCPMYGIPENRKNDRALEETEYEELGAK